TGQYGQGEQVVHGAVEEALDLGGVQVHRHDPVRAGDLEHVRDQPGGDGLTSAVLLVLAAVTPEGHHGGDPFGGGPLERVHHDQLLHDGVVDRGGVGLHDEGVAAADRFLEPDEDLPVGKGVGRLRGDGDVEAFGHLVDQLRVVAPGQQHQ